MKIRIAERSDLDSIVAIYNHAVEDRATADMDPVTADSRVAWFDGHLPARRPILAAASDEGLLGWAALSDYRGGRRALRHTAEISYYVDRKHRRRGVASGLVRAAIDLCPSLEIRTLFAILLEDNVGSIRLLESFEFEKWGRMPRVADFAGTEIGHLYYGLRLR